MSTSLISMKFLRNSVTRLIKTSFSAKYLLYTNVAVSVVLSTTGDIIQQQYEILTKDQKEWNKRRTRTMSVCGFTLGLFCHNWYNFLDRQLPGYTLRTVVKKIAVDQAVCSPVCVGTFIGVCGVLEGKSFEVFVSDFKKQAWMLYVAEWAVWPPAQFINFYFFSTKYRVLYDSIISLGYDVYASYVMHRSNDKDKDS